MTCQNCNSNKIIRISGPDIINITLEETGKTFKDIFPVQGIGLTNVEDDVQILDFRYCAECGQIQGGFPLKQEAVEGVLDDTEQGEEDIDEFEGLEDEQDEFEDPDND